MKDFIKEQQEMARDFGEQSINNTYFQYTKHELDTLIQQTIANTGAEIMRKIEPLYSEYSKPWSEEDKIVADVAKAIKQHIKDVTE